MTDRRRAPATAYHRQTSYERNRLSGHVLDWENQPLPYKDYPGAETKPLPTAAKVPKTSLWASGAPDRGSGPDPFLDLERLAAICALTHSFTARRTLQGQTYLYRSVASAGALYPAELYLAAYNVAGLNPGVYYYDIREFALKALRIGLTAEDRADRGATAAAPPVAAVFFITGNFFRSAWKYRARAMRYVLLDAGHLLENLRRALQVMGLGFQIDYDFDDAAHNSLLGLDSAHEAVYVQVTVWLKPTRGNVPFARPSISSQAFAPIAPAAGPVGPPELVYTEIGRIHRAGLEIRSKAAPADTALQVTETGPATWRALPPYARPEHERAYDEAVVQRRSKRNFIDRPLPEQWVVNLLHLAGSTLLPAGAEPWPARAGLQVGFLCGAVTGMAPGFYLLDGVAKKTGCLRTGQLTSPMATVCLDQLWLKNAGLHFLLMVNLCALDRFWGARGYRYVMLEAGRVGQSLYLGATALGLGCCGIGALYDDEARGLLGLNPDSALLYLVAVGQVR